jgi:hypothetical protein
LFETFSTLQSAARQEKVDARPNLFRRINMATADTDIAAPRNRSWQKDVAATESKKKVADCRQLVQDIMDFCGV